MDFPLIFVGQYHLGSSSFMKLVNFTPWFSCLRGPNGSLQISNPSTSLEFGDPSSPYEMKSFRIHGEIHILYCIHIYIFVCIYNMYIYIYDYIYVFCRNGKIGSRIFGSIILSWQYWDVNLPGVGSITRRKPSWPCGNNWVSGVAVASCGPFMWRGHDDYRAFWEAGNEVGWC